MKKYNIISTFVLSALCAPLLFSCSDGKDDEEKDISGLPKFEYCVFDEEKMCLPGPAQVCPKGGKLFNDCPVELGYIDMKTMVGNSSGGEGQSSSGGGNQSSSSSREYQAPGTFSADNIFLDPRDGKEYNFVISGEKVWMLSNLNYSRDNTTGWCYGVDVNSENSSQNSTGCNGGHGRIYDYITAIDGNLPQGLCPKGWHIPSAEEWASAATGLPNEFYMKSGKYDVNDLNWKERGSFGYYWMSSGNINNFALIVGNSLSIGTSTSLTLNNYSVRCVADGEIECGSKLYNPAVEFCLQNEVYTRCGGLMYKPELEFCSGAAIILKCGGLTYNPETHGCLSEVVFPKCFSTLYNPTTHFCSADSKIFSKCGGESYDPEKQGCFEEEVFSKCGEALYDSTAYFCYDKTTIYELCGDLEYNPTEQFCGNNSNAKDSVYTKCGGKEYKPLIEGCSGTTILSKCGAKFLYTPATQFCHKNSDAKDSVYTRCGTTAYNPETQFCSGTMIYEFCGGKEYRPAIEGCSDAPDGKKVLMPKCGSALYDTTAYFCSGTTILPKNFIVFSEDFEGATSTWTIPAYTGINRWVVGTATSYEGLKSAYITNNGSNNAYIIGTISASNIHNLVTFPVSSANFTLSFYWKCVGDWNADGSGFDYMTVYLAPSALTLTGGKPVSDYVVGNAYLTGYKNSSTWTSETINLPAATYSGKEYRLVFHWQNDDVYGTQPPCAIDNIKIYRGIQ